MPSPWPTAPGWPCTPPTKQPRVVAFLADKARLSPVQAPLPPGTRRLVAVTGVAQDDGGRLRTTSPVSGAPGDVICVLEPPDAQRPRLRRRGRAERAVADFTLEPLTEEQWLWQQLARLSACIGRETHSRGGVLLHSGLAAHPDLSGFQNRSPWCTARRALPPSAQAVDRQAAERFPPGRQKAFVVQDFGNFSVFFSRCSSRQP
jgi:hypothetical protein